MNDADWEDIIKSREMCSSDIMSTILDLHERMIELEHHILNAEPNLITRVYNAEKHLEKLESMMPPLNEQIISKLVLLDRIEKLELAFSEHRNSNRLHW